MDAGNPPPPLTSVNNLRDLNSALSSILPGKIYRSSNPACACQNDTDVLLEKYGIRNLIDLRAADEMEGDGDSAIFNAASNQEYKRGLIGSLQAPEVGKPANQVVRYHLSLLERKRYYVSLIRRLPMRLVATAVAQQLWDPKAGRMKIVQQVNNGGLPLLYRILLESSQPEILEVMRIITTAAEASEPTMFFCRAGKDRTGLIAMLVLSVCGASNQEIIADYIKSDEFHQVGLAGLEDEEELTGLDISVFQRAPPEAMEVTLQYLTERFGGVAAYLEAIGFTLAERRRLKKALTGNV